MIINVKLEDKYMIKIEKIDKIAASRKHSYSAPQWQAIAITGADVLVAAAAGSGKTEVLSERIARKVASNRWDIDRLLVLTFTTAAAKNMIVRIENKISERLLSTNKEEDLIYLRKQRMLMNDAYISTIDSFCLNVLKKFYYLVEEKIDKIAASRKHSYSAPQWQAISITGADVLVAAAAGSGKTEVLSERIARKVASNRWDVDRLLVLTFTTAAAKNMIVRIENKIGERLLSTNKEEDLIYLRKQRMLMNDAYISTIDSFCLNVLKKFYYLVEEKIDNEIKYLSPNFSILANSRGLLIETIGNVLEQLVQEASNTTDLLFTVFGTKQNISSYIIDLYYKLLNIPNLENYLDENFTKLNNLVTNNFEVEENSIIDKFNKVSELTQKESIATAIDFCRYVEQYLINSKKASSLDLLSLVNLDETKKEKLAKYVDESDMSIKSNQEQLEEIEELISKLNAQFENEDNIYDTGVLSEVHGVLIDYLNYFKVLEKMNLLAKAITRVLKKLHNDFIKRKRENNFLDFSDLNHLAIKALTREENGEIVPSEAAQFYKNYFLEIYVDEYQDNNNLQEYILNLIRGEGVYFT